MPTDKDRQPEAEASLEAASRSGSEKPRDQALKAQPDTAPKPEDSSRKQKDAADVLRKGAEKDPARCHSIRTAAGQPSVATAGLSSSNGR